jgi:beta-1,4-mannosyl-glycoprotein beta-1,4-N-acetylglucosaminyltransferase
MKIVDCFIFYNELDLLKYRLHLLNEVVDYFVLVESTHTFVGKEKQLYYQENQHLFEAFHHKIIHVVVNDLPRRPPMKYTDVWDNEIFQRNAMARGIPPLEDSDLLLFSDVDEIPDPRTLQTVKEGPLRIHSLQMDMYYYNLTTKMESPWTRCKLLTYQTYQQLNATCEEIRNMTCPIFKGGWHLSYFGDASFISNKIKHFSHQELNVPQFTDVNHISQMVKHHKDLYGRPIQLTAIRIEENSYLPPDYSVHLTNYY